MYETLVKLVATLLVLKRLSQLTDKSFPVFFTPKIGLRDGVDISPSKYAEALKKAVHFASAADKKYPSLYSQLELGHNWEHMLENFSIL